MKKMIYCLLLVGLFACDDGDLQIETIDFDDIAVSDCGDISTSGTNLLFKISGDEALILQLESGFLKNEETSDTSTIPTQSKLIYRLFSGDVSNSYFCNELPLATPTVTQELEAESGTVTVTTVANDDATTFTHTITLEDITFIDGSGNRITDLTVNEFGTVTTTVSN